MDSLLGARLYLDEDVDEEQFTTDLRQAEAKVFGVDGYHSRNYANGRGAIVAFDPTQIKSATANTGAFGIDEEDVRFSFLGKRGAQSLDAAEEVTHRMDNLAVAREMEAAGKDARAVKMATGWERGADGKWRYEVDDSQSTFYPEGDWVARQDWPGYKEDVERIGELLEKKENAMLFDFAPLTEAEARELAELQEKRRADIEHWRQRRDKGNARLMDVLDAPELFRAYPQLKNVTVDFADLPRGGATGSITPDGKNITLARWLDSHNKETVLHHEIQHAIQFIEGFATGTSPDTLTKKHQNARKDAVRAILVQLENLGFSNDVRIADPDFLPEKADPKELLGLAKTWVQYYAPETEKANLSKSIANAEKELSRLDEEGDANDRYRRTAGEVEARNTQSRLGMTPEQRRATLAAETEDVAREDQIVLREMAEAASMDSEPVGNSDGLGEKQGVWHQYDGEDYTPKRAALSEAQQRAVLDAVNKARANVGENPLANMDEVSRLTDIQELAAGFAALAESEGWTVPKDVGTSHHARANRYFTITRGDFDGDDYVEMSVRVSDHARTSSQHTRETDINLVPSARAVGDDYEWAYDTFESALYKLQNATGDEFGEAMLDGEPMM
ncbi:MAG: hypothetical protein IKU14_08440, partial [Rhodocyclaceae bacterium]|nr:hypothetical protein [Rhodocyclaceae bacterium]